MSKKIDSKIEYDLDKDFYYIVFIKNNEEVYRNCDICEIIGIAEWKYLDNVLLKFDGREEYDSIHSCFYVYYYDFNLAKKALEWIESTIVINRLSQRKE